MGLGDGVMAEAVLIADDQPRLNPALDRAALAAEFQRKGRIHVQRLLTRPAAQRIYSCLADETRYELFFNDGDKNQALANLTPQQRQEQVKAAWRRVGMDTFQFLYERHMLTLNGEAYGDPAHHWASVVSFLNSPEFLGFTREITGMAQIALADAQATVYRAGQFLTVHDDNRPGHNRLLAYVMSFTPAWRAEWGGLLEFPGEDGQIEAGYVPNFNSLRLFQVSKKHFVSCVAPYAVGGRYSVTGWLRAR